VLSGERFPRRWRLVVFQEAFPHARAWKCGGAWPLGWVARDTPEPELGIALVADLDGNLVELPSSAEAVPRI
jgi:hypothetical protein